MEKIRKRITFYGRVQGVGFRYHARNHANSLSLTGWVRNEYDGSVLMEVQGDQASIDYMIQMLHQDQYIDIVDFEARVISTNQEEKSFVIQDT